MGCLLKVQRGFQHFPSCFATETSRATTAKKMTVLSEGNRLSTSSPPANAVASQQQTMAPPGQTATRTATQEESDEDDARVAFESEPEPDPKTSDDIAKTVGKSAAMAIELLDSDDEQDEKDEDQRAQGNGGESQLSSASPRQRESQPANVASTTSSVLRVRSAAPSAEDAVPAHSPSSDGQRLVQNTRDESTQVADGTTGTSRDVDEVDASPAQPRATRRRSKAVHTVQNDVDQPPRGGAGGRNVC